MADSEQQGQQPQTPPEGGGEAEPSEEELRAQLEEEIRKVRVQDVILQSAVSVLNLAARRIAKEDERDLEQGRVGIEAARALADLVPEEAQGQLRQAVSELQLLYAKHAEEEGGGPAPGGGGPSGGEPASGEPIAGEPEKPGGPGLWTPHQRD